MENIELRSENVRKIIGQIPHALIRSGISVIALVIALLLAAAAFIPYPETLQGEAVIGNSDNNFIYAHALLPYSSFAQVKTEMNVEIELEGFNAREYGHQHGTISYISPEVITRNGKNYFSVTIVLSNHSFMREGMKGYVSVILSDRALLSRIFS